jgi:hypothetical protein
MAVERFEDLFFRGMRAVAQEVFRLQDLTMRTEPALNRSGLDEGFLNRM